MKEFWSPEDLVEEERIKNASSENVIDWLRNKSSYKKNFSDLRNDIELIWYQTHNDDVKLELCLSGQSAEMLKIATENALVSHDAVRLSALSRNFHFISDFCLLDEYVCPYYYQKEETCFYVFFKNVINNKNVCKRFLDHLFHDIKNQDFGYIRFLLSNVWHYDYSEYDFHIEPESYSNPSVDMVHLVKTSIDCIKHHYDAKKLDAYTYLKNIILSLKNQHIDIFDDYYTLNPIDKIFECLNELMLFHDELQFESDDSVEDNNFFRSDLEDLHRLFLDVVDTRYKTRSDNHSVVVWNSNKVERLFIATKNLNIETSINPYYQDPIPEESKGITNRVELLRMTKAIIMSLPDEYHHYYYNLCDMTRKDRTELVDIIKDFNLDFLVEYGGLDELISIQIDDFFNAFRWYGYSKHDVLGKIIEIDKANNEHTITREQKAITLGIINNKNFYKTYDMRCLISEFSSYLSDVFLYKKRSHRFSLDISEYYYPSQFHYSESECLDLKLDKILREKTYLKKQLENIESNIVESNDKKITSLEHEVTFLNKKLNFLILLFFILFFLLKWVY